MSKDTDYVTEISKYTRATLRKLWRAIDAGDTPGWDPGKAFEYLILRAFQLEGAEVRWPYSVREVEFALRKKYMRRGLVTNYRICVERGLPDYNIRVEELV